MTDDPEATNDDGSSLRLWELALVALVCVVAFVVSSIKERSES